jgi:hypothetical protein
MVGRTEVTSGLRVIGAPLSTSDDLLRRTGASRTDGFQCRLICRSSGQDAFRKGISSGLSACRIA